MSCDWEALLAEARSESTSLCRLEELLFTEFDEEICTALLENSNIFFVQEDERLHTLFFEQIALKYPDHVAEHPAFVLHVFIEPNDDMEAVVIHVLQNTENASLIDNLFRVWNNNEFVRKNVASNWNTPLEILRVLGNKATESNRDVRHAVAQNRNTPEDVLRILGNQATEPNWKVRSKVVEHPNTPEDVFRILGNQMTESDLDVRSKVAHAKKTPVDVLHLLANPKTEKEMIVREVAHESLKSRGLT